MTDTTSSRSVCDPQRQPRNIPTVGLAVIAVALVALALVTIVRALIAGGVS